MRVVYYWYDHLILRSNGEAKIVTQAIEDHDYDTFMEYYNKYSPSNFESKDGYPVVFFPDTAYLLDEDGHSIGEIDITTSEGFEMITDCDYECG